MKNIATVVLSLALAASIISGLILYHTHYNTKNALVGSENKLAALEKKVGQLAQEKVLLHDQIRENTERLNKLKDTQTRISELEYAITIKDQILAEFKKTIQILKKDLEEERKANKSLINNLTSKDAMIHELQEQSQVPESYILYLEEESAKKDSLVSESEKKLQAAQAHVLYLEGEIAKKHNEIGVLNRELSVLKGKKATNEAKMGQLKSTYEALVSDLNHQIENQEVTIKNFEEKISVTFVDRILFDFGKATITPEGRKILKRVGEILQNIHGRKIRVVGHSDNIPILPLYQSKFPSNWELSASRAAAVVRDFQQNADIDPANLEAVGRSFYDPIASNETEEGRALNRRVEIIIAPKLDS